MADRRGPFRVARRSPAARPRVRGGLTGCPLIPTQARPPPRWGTTRGVWSTGARSPRALGDLWWPRLVGRPRPSAAVVAPVRRPSVAHHHQVVDRRLPAPRPRSQLTIDTPFAVRSWGLDEHRGPARRPASSTLSSSFAITASSRSSSSAIFSPTRRQRPATPRRWQVTRTAARSAAPERFPPARPRRRQPARATPPFTNRTSRVLALLVRLATPDGDGGCRRRRPRRRRRPQRSEPPRPGPATGERGRGQARPFRAADRAYRPRHLPPAAPARPRSPSSATASTP